MSTKMHTLSLGVVILTVMAAAAGFPSMPVEPRQLPGGGGQSRFNAEEQRVSTTGNHRFIAPGEGDMRGVCPGLNALANHNYIPRNGIATVPELVKGCVDAIGMGVDLATAVAELLVVLGGDLISGSIGGPPRTWSLLAGLLGRPGGLTNTHNRYEADCSATRGDLYQYGDAAKLQLSAFEELHNEPLGPNGYDLPLLARHHVRRFRQSKAGNPYFFHSSASLIVSSGATNFIYRLMANKSAEYPQGYMDQNILKTFLAVTGEPGSFRYTPGHERIPDNWYKRAIGDEYMLAATIADIVKESLVYPELLSIGGNLGQVNTFVGVDIANLTGGVYNAQNLLQGNNAACLAFRLAQNVVPSIVQGLFSRVQEPLARLNSLLGDATSSLNCPQLQKIDRDQLNQFPGASFRF